MQSLRDSKKTNDVDLWQQAHRLALVAYRVTGEFPVGEHDALATYIRRAATSVPAAVADGFGRANERDLKRRLSSAQGAVSEVFALCLLARDLGIVSLETFDVLHGEARRVSMALSERQTPSATRAA
ncbi:MAG: four helix bundle protein [Polyangiaceae bacterium]